LIPGLTKQDDIMAKIKDIENTASSLKKFMHFFIKLTMILYLMKTVIILLYSHFIIEKSTNIIITY
jgi:hypothetical protein